MYLYWIRKEKRFLPDVGWYRTFGIGVWKVFPGVWPVAFVPDVSTDGKALLRLALQCTVCGLHPCQLTDVVEDFLR